MDGNMCSKSTLSSTLQLVSLKVITLTLISSCCCHCRDVGGRGEGVGKGERVWEVLLDTPTHSLHLDIPAVHLISNYIHVHVYYTFVRKTIVCIISYMKSDQSYIWYHNSDHSVEEFVSLTILSYSGIYYSSRNGKLLLIKKWQT